MSDNNTIQTWDSIHSNSDIVQTWGPVWEAIKEPTLSIDFSLTTAMDYGNPVIMWDVAAPSVSEEEFKSMCEQRGVSYEQLCKKLDE